jgi:hypothetical protein
MDVNATPVGHHLPSAPAASDSAPAFQYTGHMSLTVRGPITGRIYHFTGAGVVLSVDPRDAPSLAAVPQLQRTVQAQQSH